MCKCVGKLECVRAMCQSLSVVREQECESVSKCGVWVRVPCGVSEHVCVYQV